MNFLRETRGAGENQESSLLRVESSEPTISLPSVDAQSK